MRTGILGGTFDPIHKGHIAIALRTLEYFELDTVVLMVARVPPHKPVQALASAFHRFAMAALEASEDTRLRVSDWELRRPGPSYTCDTLREWSRSFAGSDLCFIAGMDSLLELHLWKDCAKLLTQYCFVFVQRPGIEADLDRLTLAADLRKRLTPIQEDGPRPELEPGRSFILPSRHRPVSSTQIRKSLLQRRPTGPELLSPSVLEHIRKHHLYERDHPEVS